MPYYRRMKDEELPAPKIDDPYRGQVIKPKPWEDDVSELEDAYTRARCAAMHGLTGPIEREDAPAGSARLR